jgi:hypothetical protein
MTKSTLAKWAFAALMAVPAVPMFGKTLHHKYVVHRAGHSALVSTTARKHLTHKTTRHAGTSTLVRRHRSLTASRSLLTSRSHRLSHKTTRHTSLSKTTPQFKVHVTKMPPTIDGINA